MITVFTPTYNRAYKLKDLYKSLRKQTDKNFEWLIIDDGSNDGTENLVTKFKKDDNGFEIRFYKQKHGGKHRALNKAFDLAKGEYFFTVDSDDKLLGDAIKYISEWTEKIDSRRIAGVAGLRVKNDGRVLGGRTDKKDGYVEASNFERAKFGLLGDKAEVYRTDLLRRYHFPEFDGEDFVTEDVCYQEIAHAGYKIRWYNKPIYVCEYLSDGLTKGGANEMKGHLENPKGYCHWVKRCMKVRPLRDKCIILRDYWRFSSVVGGSILEQARRLDMSLFEYLFHVGIEFPISCLIYIANKIIGKNRR